ncbi:Crp/Fnr family transcriptional regulator [Geminicoccus harenae]|uniref:Crp/Fnr family transcriptional regulator n=1 Tax=Geminicoccus harenae TaxID=2498453 RepID=UPI00168B2752|nr:Crp/Fnr family transcriptional regulator [Geminicoccus harenae]
MAPAALEEFPKIGPLQGLPAAALADLYRQCRRIEHEAGQILDQPAAEDGVLLILEGEAEIRHHRPPARPLWLESLGPGSLIGAFALLDRPREHCTIQALTPIRMVLIPPDLFRSLLERHACVSMRLLHELIRRVHGLDDRLATLTRAQAEIEQVRRNLMRFIC